MLCSRSLLVMLISTFKQETGIKFEEGICVVLKKTSLHGKKQQLVVLHSSLRLHIYHGDNISVAVDIISV